MASQSLTIKQLLLTESVHEPAVITDVINHWKAKHWSANFFSEHAKLAQSQILFRVREAGRPNKRPRVGIDMSS